VKPTADPLTALTQAYAFLFVLILPAPLKRTPARADENGNSTTFNQNHALCSGAVEFVSHLEPSLGYVKVVAIVFVNLNAVVFIALDIGIQRRKKLSSSRKA
jgi:hypothetical protein